MTRDMAHHAPEASEFYAELRPNRSLSRTGFIVVLAGFAMINAVFATLFVVAGAWPVSGFFGLDVLGVTAAFWIYRRRWADVSEIIDLRPDLLTVTKIRRRRAKRVWTCQPYWLRVELEVTGEVVGPLWLYSHGRGLRIAEFLGGRDRREFAAALRVALARVQP